MSTIETLKESIQFDAERLANIQQLNERGLLAEPPPGVGMVIFHRVIKNGRREQVYRAVKQYPVTGGAGGHWHLHLNGAAINSTHILGWAGVVTRVIEMDNPVITAVEYYSCEDRFDLGAF